MQLIFDFDGTLADSSPGIYASFQLACNSLDLQAPDFETFCSSIGPPVERLAQRFFPDLTENSLQAFRAIFRDDYDNHRFRQCVWYEGVKSTIKTLAVLPSAKLAIVTNKPTKPTRHLLHAADLLAFFPVVIGIDYQVHQGTGPLFVSKAEAISLVYSQCDQSTDPAFYIGDTLSDRDASHACGITFIAATYGFHRWSDADLCEIASIASISDLPSLLGAGSAAFGFNSP
jgi:phosphoglycolate phosphatase